VISSLISQIVPAGLTSALLVLYLSPLVVGWVRRTPQIGVIAVINILLGWTLIGWLAALAMAFRSMPPPGPPQAPPPTAGSAGWAQHLGPPALRPGSPPPLVIPPRLPVDHEDAGHPDRPASWVG
jgi:Superinfection immunity protein